jgi:hypothetical protein
VRDAWLPAHSSLWLSIRIITTWHPELTPPLRRGTSSVKKTIHRSSTSILWYLLLTPPLPRVLLQIPPILAKSAPTPIPTYSSILLVICSIRREWSCGRNDRLLRMLWIRGFWTFCRRACRPLLLLAWSWGQEFGIVLGFVESVVCFGGCSLRVGGLLLLGWLRLWLLFYLLCFWLGLRGFWLRHYTIEWFIL